VNKLAISDESLTQCGTISLNWMMILRRLAFLFATASFIASPALAEEKSNPPKPDDMVCKFEKEMGSNIPKKVCKTRADRDAEKREAAAVMREREQGQRTAGRNGTD
jgi:hypothetical protein